MKTRGSGRLLKEASKGGPESCGEEKGEGG